MGVVLPVGLYHPRRPRTERHDSPQYHTKQRLGFTFTETKMQPSFNADPVLALRRSYGISFPLLWNPPVQPYIG